MAVRRITLRILAASLTFAIGIGFASAWFYIRDRPLSSCSVTTNPAYYDGKLVRMRGELFVSSNGMIYLNGTECGLRSNAWTEVSFRANPPLIAELQQQISGDVVPKCEVVLTGTFKDRKRSCFTAQFEISGASLERASEVTVVNFPEEIQKEDALNRH